MKFCVLGGGAIGGQITARLALAGEAVTLVIRHEVHRATIARDGLTLLSPGAEAMVARPANICANPAEAGHHDVVFLAVKAQQVKNDKLLRDAYLGL